MLDQVRPLSLEVVELVSNAGQLAENPHWCPEDGRLYWTDILGGAVHGIDPDSRVQCQIYAGPSVGGFTRQADGKWLFFREADYQVLPHEGGEPLRQWNFQAPQHVTRFNDVIADAQGRVLAGTFQGGNPGEGTAAGLFRIEHDGTAHLLWNGTGISNGMDWSLDDKTFYWVDSSARTVFAFDWNAARGVPSNRRVLLKLSPPLYEPDGLTVDLQGNIWLAVWEGACVLKIAPSGEMLGKLALPVKRVTSVAFGGADYKTLFITTAADAAGTVPAKIFSVQPGVGGRREHRSRIGL